jgi:transcription initiation factor TFIIIB Brf1 subunit/transcription initiation factor TFIIB
MQPITCQHCGAHYTATEIYAARMVCVRCGKNIWGKPALSDPEPTTEPQTKCKRPTPRTTDERRAYQRQYYYDHREAMLAYMKTFRAENPELAKAQRRADYDRHKAARLLWQKQYYRKNKVALLAKRKERQARRRAQAQAAEVTS